MKLCRNVVCLFLMVIFSYVGTASSLQQTQCNPELVTILSIDGGGAKGIIPAVILREIERTEQQRIANLFDFMVGTSSGSLIISALSAPDSTGKAPKFTAAQIVQFYQERVKEIFSESIWYRLVSLGGLILPKFQMDGKMAALKEFFQDLTLNQLVTNVAVMSYDLKSRGLIVFKNWESKLFDPAEIKVRDIVDGSTSIMSLFPPKTIYDSAGAVKYRLADAAFIVNNPSIYAFLLAYNKCRHAKHYVFISIGEGRSLRPNLKADLWGVLQWGGELLYSTLEGETVAGTAVMTNLASIFNAQDKTDSKRVLFIRLEPFLTRNDNNPLDSSDVHMRTLAAVGKEVHNINKPLLGCVMKLIKNRSYDKIDAKCMSLLERHSKIKQPYFFHTLAQ